MSMTGFISFDSTQCILNEYRIDLWQFSLEQNLNLSYQILNAEEKARSQRFHFSQHQRRFATARTLLRIILARYLNTTPKSLEFVYNSQGKPSVINLQRLQFNISHSGDLAILAVGKGYPMGVDIEHYSARPYEGIAENSFSEQEIKELKKTPKALKAAVFFHLWSQKEAFIKACGLGLSYPTKEFTVPSRIPTQQLVEDPLHNLTWQLRSFMPKAACSGALCCHPTIKEIRHTSLAVHPFLSEAM